MLLGHKRHSAGNAIRYEVDYGDWLADGETLSINNCTITLTSTFTATVTDITITGKVVTASKIYFILTGGSLNETFTLDAHAETTRGEKKNDTLGFTIVAP